jgi:hypothetical protein
MQEDEALEQGPDPAPTSPVGLATQESGQGDEDAIIQRQSPGGRR